MGTRIRRTEILIETHEITVIRSRGQHDLPEPAHSDADGSIGDESSENCHALRDRTNSNHESDQDRNYKTGDEK